VIKSTFGDRVDGLIHRLLPFLFRKRVNPNLLTVLGALISLIAAAALAFGWFVVGGVLVLAGGACDLVDGVIARHHGMATRFGAFLDSTLDRLADMALLLGIAMYYVLAGEPGLVLLAGYTLVSSVLVSYVQAKAELVVPDFRVGLMERAERVVILALGALLELMAPALWIVAIGSTITLIQRFALAYREMEQLDAVEQSSLGEHS
jgi:CDP-diacylglycerol--glycerol-3-phosphate 3-phosphatidyltransferase